MSLTEKEKKLCLRLVRDTLAWYLKHNHSPNIEDLKITPTETLKKSAGTFVTIRHNKTLRGCIGTIVSEDPIYKSLIKNTLQAATEDPRFPAITNMKELTFEISILTHPEPINPHDIQIGKHGIILRSGAQQSLFLPKVPIEFGWDLKTTIMQLATKAKISPLALQKNAKFFAFEALEFKEA